MGLIKTGLKAAVAVKAGHLVHDRISAPQAGRVGGAGQSGGHDSADVVHPERCQPVEC